MFNYSCDATRVISACCVCAAETRGRHAENLDKIQSALEWRNGEFHSSDSGHVEQLKSLRKQLKYFLLIISFRISSSRGRKKNKLQNIKAKKKNIFLELRSEIRLCAV